MSPTSYRAAPPRSTSVPSGYTGVNRAPAAHGPGVIAELHPDRYTRPQYFPGTQSSTLLPASDAEISARCNGMSELYVILLANRGRLAGRRHLPHLSREDQGRLPRGWPIAAGRRAGAHPPHILDRRRFLFRRRRKRIQERFRLALTPRPAAEQVAQFTE
jgi:hypothetical protein